MDYQKAIKEAEIQIDMYESMILYNKDFEPKNDNSNYERKMDFLKTAISAMQELQEYKQLGTLEEVRDAVYRREPLKIKIGEKYNKGYMSKAYFCNHCNKFICFKGIEKSTTICHTYLFCNNCGQKLDWGESNE